MRSWRVLLWLAAAMAVAAEEESPLVEMARTLMQEQMQGQGAGAGALGAVGALLQTFAQGGGGRQLGEMLKDGDLLSTIGSALADFAGKDAYEGDPDSPLIDRKLIVDVVSAFTSAHSDENNNDVKQGADPHKKPHLDLGVLLEFASNLAAPLQGQEGGGGAALEGLGSILPAIMQMAGGGGPAKGDAGDVAAREGRPSMFEPILAALRDYWDHFMSSELGQTLWNTSGLGDTLKLFTDERGNFDTERIYRSLENASFRKRWVRSLATYVSEWITHVSDPATQKRYLTTAQFVGNGLLKAQGYPKSAMFDPVKPAESLSRLVDAVFKKQFGLKIESAKYIKPAVAYLQEVFELGRAKGLSLSHLSPKEIEDKLTDTISGQIIEPAMRVWRAYWYATRHPQCSQYVICAVNQKDDSTEGGLKPSVTKVSSAAAIWFLSGVTNTSFWDLYTAAVESYDCQVKFPVDCSTFHEEDIKATTEYIHSEL